MKNNSNIQSRKSNLELLRIVSMIAIVTIHCFRHGIDVDNNVITANRLIYELFSFVGRFGVLCFVMITGYFMVDSKMKIRSLIKMIAEVIFYTVVIEIIFILIGKKDFRLKIIIMSFFPVTLVNYWFISVYVALYLLTPFLNILIKNLNKKNYIILIAILLIIYSIIPTFTGQRWRTTTEFYQELGLFITMYIIAGYIKKYPNKYFNSIKLNIIISLCMQLVIWITILLILFFRNKLKINDPQYFTDFNSLFIIIQSISIFLIFKDISIKNSKIINSISSSTLAVYLIHENLNVYPVLWKKIFKTNIYYNYSTGIFVMRIIGSILFVFIFCILIDKIRIYLFEKKFLKLYDNNKEKIKDRVTKLIDITIDKKDKMVK